MSKKRKSLSKRTRFDVFKRDQFTCQYCGRTPPTVVLQIDHVIAVASGGGDESTNLLTSCEDCNNGKSDKPLSETPAAIATELAAQVERREQLEEYNRFLIESRDRESEVVRELGRYWFNKLNEEKDRWTFGDKRQASIRLFLRRLPVTDLFDAIDIVHSRVSVRMDYDEKGWKYFCGICWKKIREREGTPE